MKVLWIIIVIEIVKISCDDYEYVTIWAPKNIYNKNDYNIVILPKNIDERTEISFKYRKIYATTALASDKIQEVKIPNSRYFRSTKKNDLTMILHRNKTTSLKTRQMCLTQNIQTTEASNELFYIFIQTDKPAYKPGEKVRLRVVVVDRDLKQFYVNNIAIKITDPLNQIIFNFDDAFDMYKGVFTNSFDLPENYSVGTWKISVVVDKLYEFETSKKFTVRNTKSPHFYAYINANDKQFLVNSVIKMSLFAKYSFGEFVRGNANLSIKCITNGITMATRSFENIFGIQDIQLSARDDLKAMTSSYLEYEAELVFTESGSDVSERKTIKFTVHDNDKSIIQVNHPEKFLPGLPFGVNVFVYDWKRSLIKNSNNRVELTFEFRTNNETSQITKVYLKIIDGIVKYNFLVPKEANELNIKVKFLEATYERTVGKGAVVVGINKLIIDYEPKRPKHRENVEIYVKANLEIDQLIAIVASRKGNIESRQINCDFELTCQFSINIRKEMMPSAKVIVYHLRNKNSIYQGEITINTNELGANSLNISLQSSAKTNEEVEITFTTQPKSTVYLLGYDKLLDQSDQYNSMNRENIIDRLADFDGTNQVTVYQIRNSNWHDCTLEEIRQIEKGRRYVVDHSSNHYEGIYQSDEDIAEDEDLENSSNLVNADENAFGVIREDFRNVWLFENVEVPYGEVTKHFITPDSMTSWTISAFSMNNDYGLAIAQPMELIVKKDFFIRVVLPDLIRFREIIRVDVVVHNYLVTKEPLNVEISISEEDNKGNIKFLIDKCTKAPIEGRKVTKTIRVPFNNVQRVSFYMQPGDYMRNILNFIKLRVEASTNTGYKRTLKDKVVETLKVEPMMILNYQSEVTNYYFNSNKINDSLDFSMSRDKKASQAVQIIGDFLDDELKNIKLGHEFDTNYITRNTILQFKGNVEHFRYLKSQSARSPTARFSNHYLNIINQRNSFRDFVHPEVKAYFMEAVACAIEIGAYSAQQSLIDDELYKLEIHQTQSGKFSVLRSILDSQSEHFKTAYILLPFIKFKNQTTKSYDDVIRQGFNYLRELNNSTLSNKEPFSIAAYAYALNGNIDEAENFLKTVERDDIQIDEQRRCFKLSRSHSNCDLRHTSYAALAYLTLNKFYEAQSLISYIYNEYKKIRDFSSYSFKYGVSTEALAKFMIARPKTSLTNLKITLTSDPNFIKVLHITKENQKQSIDVSFPEFNLNPRITIEGSGSCTVKKIAAGPVKLNSNWNKFKVNVKTFSSTPRNKETVQVCATYKLPDLQNIFEIQDGIVYDIEMPNGYVYESFNDLTERTETKLVVTAAQKTKVLIFYRYFKTNKEYCVNINATKVFEVRKTEDAAVSIYDFNDISNFAVEYFRFGQYCQ